MDPRILIQMIKSGQNPQQLMLHYLQNQQQTPLNMNLLNLARNGQTAEIEKIARNLYAQQGGQDFDLDFKTFIESLGFYN